MRLGRILAVAAVLLCGAADIPAKTVNVSVGGYTTSGGNYYGGSTESPVLMFNPANITINVGDSVTFNNLGGIAVAHNVHADDDSFRCANGCDGQGGNGTPAFNEWSSTVTFTKAGVVKYHCDEHASLGMTGTITVNAVASAFTISPGLSGNWFNPTAGQDGHGFQFEILPGNGMLAIWFVFTPDASGQTWLYAQGAYDPTSNTVTLPAFLSQGAKFPPNFTHADDHVTQWGTLTFTFTDCNNGTMSWTSTTAGYPPTGNLPITRATGIAGLACP
ncbi:MAG TPA: plastocyanin/azurin family copper-binding protein [Rudaea sp.]|nr:plastocyanin/azurin family copper-binding protein [Rudaea sp.]